MDRPVVSELIQDECNPERLAEELRSILFDDSRRKKMQADFAELRALLGQGGLASAQAARSIVDGMKGISPSAEKV